MPTTKYRLAEQVVRLLNGGDISVASKVQINEAKIAVEQAVNSLLKMEYLRVNMKMGEMIPNAASVATYDNVLVTAYQQTSKATLPAIPLKLPRDMGVFEIYNPLNPDCLFIPLEMGMHALLKDQPLISDLLGHVGYRRYGNDIVFQQDITIPNEDTYVSMRLVVLDISQYSDWDILPVPADMESQVIGLCLEMFGREPVKDEITDSGHNEQSNVPVPQQAQQ